MDITLDPSLPPKSRECLEKHFHTMITSIMCNEVANTSVRFGISNNAVIRVAMEEYRCKL